MFQKIIQIIKKFQHIFNFILFLDKNTTTFYLKLGVFCFIQNSLWLYNFIKFLYEKNVCYSNYYMIYIVLSSFISGGIFIVTNGIFFLSTYHLYIIKFIPLQSFIHDSILSDKLSIDGDTDDENENLSDSIFDEDSEDLSFGE